MWDALTPHLNTACRNAFGRLVTYIPAAGGAGITITAIFEAAHQPVEIGAHVPVSTSGPVLSVVLADLVPVEPLQGDHVEIDGTTFEVTDVQPDGAGMAQLILVR